MHCLVTNGVNFDTALLSTPEEAVAHIRDLPPCYVNVSVFLAPATADSEGLSLTFKGDTDKVADALDHWQKANTWRAKAHAQAQPLDR